jgi:hypothetical protein
MKRSAIRIFVRNKATPDFVSLHPGYLLPKQRKRDDVHKHPLYSGAQSHHRSPGESRSAVIYTPLLN